MQLPGCITPDALPAPSCDDETQTTEQKREMLCFFFLFFTCKCFRRSSALNTDESEFGRFAVSSKIAEAAAPVTLAARNLTLKGEHNARKWSQALRHC